MLSNLLRSATTKASRASAKTHVYFPGTTVILRSETVQPFIDRAPFEAPLMSQCMSLTTRRALVYHATVSCTTSQRRLSVTWVQEKGDCASNPVLVEPASLGLALNGGRGETEGISHSA